MNTSVVWLVVIPVNKTTCMGQSDGLGVERAALRLYYGLSSIFSFSPGFPAAFVGVLDFSTLPKSRFSILTVGSGCSRQYANVLSYYIFFMLYMFLLEAYFAICLLVLLRCFFLTW